MYLTRSLSLALLLVPPGGLQASSGTAPLSYNRDIRPILSDTCFACHGPDKTSRKGGLRLDVRESAITELKSGVTAIVPGKVEDSELVARIASTYEDEVMPPPESHKKLNPAQKEVLKRWVAEGALYEPHWAFQRVRPVVAPGPSDLPNVETALLKWPRNPIDWFVLQRIVKAGLKPSPPAEAPSLARRIALDLTGLPPRAELLAHFDLSKLENYISAYFASPHYGERMAVDWLDAARYADTQGYQVDRDQDMHPWRDWVINAFNQNMRFDQFTIEQLAGDLLPAPTLQQKIATGFHRNHMVNVEGGIIPAEFIAEYTADRVETTATVWLGQTFNCTRCHDHKFDPFTQKDFYALKAFFSNVGEQGEGAQDSVLLPSPEFDRRLNPLLGELAGMQQTLDEKGAAEADVRAWADRLVNKKLLWLPFEIANVAAEQGNPKVSSDAQSFDVGIVPRQKKPVTITVKLPVSKKITAVRLEGASDSDRGTVILGRILASRTGMAIAMTGAEEGGSRPAADAERLHSGTPPNTILPLGANRPSQALVWQLSSPLEANADAETIEFAITIVNSGGHSEWRLHSTEAPVDQLVSESTFKLAARDAATLEPAENEKLRREFVLAQAESKEIRVKIRELSDRIATVRKEQPAAFVMQERTKSKDTFILKRGAYDNPGDKITAATPAVLPPVPPDAPLNRLGLARWLVSTEHPLTSRVVVNRLWQSLFGTGIVRTSEDFGSQGEAPSHPELLDWLAAEFMRSGWNIQHMLGLMLTSATYQQSSRLTPALLAADPDNRLLARGPRFRLQAEFVRDQALASAGLLSEKIGGKSVKPYHPPGLYELVTAGSTTNKYIEDTGEGLRRRSLYSYWKRSVTHPAMTAFDAPSRETCVLRRSRSNTPLQALNLMNDPTYIEAARHLALRMLQASPTVTAQIQHGYRTLLARPASPAELTVLTRAFERNRKDFAADPCAAVGLLTTGNSKPDPGVDPAILAAMTSIASTLLCLDETITKE